MDGRVYISRLKADCQSTAAPAAETVASRGTSLKARRVLRGERLDSVKAFPCSSTSSALPLLPNSNAERGG